MCIVTQHSKISSHLTALTIVRKPTSFVAVYPSRNLQFTFCRSREISKTKGTKEGISS